MRCPPGMPPTPPSRLQAGHMATHVMATDKATAACAAEFLCVESSQRQQLLQEKHRFERTLGRRYQRLFVLQQSAAQHSHGFQCVAPSSSRWCVESAWPAAARAASASRIATFAAAAARFARRSCALADMMEPSLGRAVHKAGAIANMTSVRRKQRAQAS